MKYRYRLDESLDKGFRRIVGDQLGRSLKRLQSGSVSIAAVHDVRKSIKRVRALVRIMRPVLGEKQFQKHNSTLAAVSRTLSPVRDTDILAETIDKLEHHFGTDAQIVLSNVKMVLAAPREAGIPAAIAEEARKMLAAEAKELGNIKLPSGSFADIEPGLRRSYKSGRSALVDAYVKPSDEAFHDLRKAVQTHWRHMALLSRAWPDCFLARIDAAKDLSQLLGEDHDLAVLSAAVAAQPTLGGSAGPVGRLARARQEEIRDEVQNRAERLFAERPRQFTRRLAIYWSTARVCPSTRGAPNNAGRAPETSLSR